MPSTMNDKLKTLFEDLGKPTLRGVRKCPKCGTYNGTRGISCKNKACDVVFKEVGEKKKLQSADAVKIITGSSTQVFSVRVRDRGPDYRSFVQLPMVPSLDANATPTLDNAIATQSAKCYVETCNKSNQTIGVSENTCNHIKSALSCFSEATPLTLKNSVLNSLSLSTETKQAIWVLATETTGPLVQRVSKNIMVVKCKPHPKQPLGFLHFAFFETLRNREQPEHKFHCSCRAFKNYKIGVTKEDCQKRCVHFYACICAFASDDKLAEEFAFYINLDATGETTESNQSILTCAFDPAPERRLVAIFNDVQQLPEVEVVIQDDGEIVTTKTKKRKKDDSLAQASSALLTLQDSGIPAVKKSSKKATLANLVKPAGNVPIDENQVSISFLQWLSSITERINQTMHYQFDGKPETLVFHVPQVFFDCLQQRISAGSRKKRLPNSTTGFVRKDALPMGTFSKYTWHITNVLHVKQIFETPEVSLEVTRSFVENRDGTFDLYGAPKVQVESIAEAYRKNENQPLIKPFELKTYLKVGNMSPDQKEPTPFIIEWIPDVLPKMKVGELRIKFEYGHQRNGQMELRTNLDHSSSSKIKHE